MIQVFYGNDVVAVREAAFALVTSFEKKGGQVQSIDADSYESGMLITIAGGTSLFGEEALYIIDTPSTKKEFYADVIEQLPSLAASSHQFVIIEGPLVAAEKKKFQKHADKLTEHKKAADDRFNTFSLTDALARKDKKMLWLLLHEAVLSGIPLEEIIGVLWWQLKTLRLAGLTSTAAEAGMKDYPYNKAKRARSAFKDGELESLSAQLLQLQHDSRLGKSDASIALEHWVLSM